MSSPGLGQPVASAVFESMPSLGTGSGTSPCPASLHVQGQGLAPEAFAPAIERVVGVALRPWLVIAGFRARVAAVSPSRLHCSRAACPRTGYIPYLCFAVPTCEPSVPPVRHRWPL